MEQNEKIHNYSYSAAHWRKALCLQDFQKGYVKNTLLKTHSCTKRVVSWRNVSG